MNRNQGKKKITKAQIVNFGCKLNQFEGESLKERLNESGIESIIVHPSELNNSDDNRTIYIINTCTVTSKSDRKARNAIYKAASLKKEGDLLIVTGCYAHTDREDISKIKGVDYIVNNFGKYLIPEIAKNEQNITYDNNLERDNSVFSFTKSVKPDRSRAYVKVQDGCSMNCSYCKVPLARGKSISRPIDEIIDYIKQLEDAGYYEVVLTGINLGSYKVDGINLAGLLERIISNTKQIGIRLSSIEPMYFKKELLDIITDDRIMPHFHVPLQSGSERILKLMRRPYSIDNFIEIINGINKHKNHPHIATDIIVGFPTESSRDFEDSYRIVETLRFSSLHIFTYSPREGTEAARMKDDIPKKEKIARSHALIELGKSLNYGYRLKFLNKEREAIFEEHGNNWIGVTDNYIKVKLQNSIDYPLGKKRGLVKITKVTPTETIANLIRKSEYSTFNL